jgi:membrane carboxypeptidase/penicillin-binding protein
MGARPIVHLASAVGLPDQPQVPSLALGTGLVSPLALTAAYAAFPNGGFAVRPRTIAHVDDADGRAAFAAEIERQRVLSPEVAFQMVSMMRDVVERGTGRAARVHGVFFPAAGKTGSTDDFKDAWFVGYSSSLVAGVWVGFDQPASIGRQAFGARVALPIWSDFMRRAARITPPREFAIPAGLRGVELCQATYRRPVDGCPTYIERFKQGDEIPSRRCELHRATFEQRAERAVETLFARLGARLKEIFRRGR